MPKLKIKGKIIRILDKRTVIINLGREQGVTGSTIFHILGEPEPVIDPETQIELGRVTVTKSRVKASQVFDKFTIATTSWVDTVYVDSILSHISGLSSAKWENVKVDEGELTVKQDEVKPWKAKSQSPVKIGDEVEAIIDVDEKVEAPNIDGTYETEDNEDENEPKVSSE